MCRKVCPHKNNVFLPEGTLQSMKNQKFECDVLAQKMEGRIIFETHCTFINRAYLITLLCEIILDSEWRVKYFSLSLQFVQKQCSFKKLLLCFNSCLQHLFVFPSPSEMIHFIYLLINCLPLYGAVKFCSPNPLQRTNWWFGVPINILLSPHLLPALETRT